MSQELVHSVADQVAEKTSIPAGRFTMTKHPNRTRASVPSPTNPLSSKQSVTAPGDVEDALAEFAERVRASSGASSAANSSSPAPQSSKEQLVGPNRTFVPAEPTETEGTMDTKASTIDMEPAAAEQLAPMHETEIVLGRRQLASVAFVVVVFLAIVAGLAYLIGRASSPEEAQVALDTQGTDATAAAALTEGFETAAVIEQPVETAPDIVETPAPAPAVAAEPVFGDPVAGHQYLQVGSVTSGVAELMVRGLRAEGLPAVATNSASGNDHKVLVGPIADAETMSGIKASLDVMKLQYFLRTN